MTYVRDPRPSTPTRSSTGCFASCSPPPHRSLSFAGGSALPLLTLWPCFSNQFASKVLGNCCSWVPLQKVVLDWTQAKAAKRSPCTCWFAFARATGGLTSRASEFSSRSLWMLPSAIDSLSITAARLQQGHPGHGLPSIHPSSAGARILSSASGISCPAVSIHLE